MVNKNCSGTCSEIVLLGYLEFVLLIDHLEVLINLFQLNRVMYSVHEKIV